MTLAIIETPPKDPWTTKKCIFFAVLSLILGGAIFALAYIGMSQHSGIGAFNQPVLSWMIEHRQSQITNIIKLITTAASPVVLIAFLGVVAIIWAAVNREIWRPLLLIATTGIATASSVALKIVTSNVRPPQKSMVMPLETGYSFPSNHTVCIIALLLIVSYLICSRRPGGWRIFFWTTVTILGTGAVALSRLYLGYHWLTDVVASVGLGLIVVGIAIIIDRIVVHRFEG